MGYAAGLGVDSGNEPTWRGRMMGWRQSVQCIDRVSCFADLPLEDWMRPLAALRRAESTGRPVGIAEFVTGLERVLGPRIARRAPNPPAASISAKQLKLLQ